MKMQVAVAVMMAIRLQRGMNGMGAGDHGQRSNVQIDDVMAHLLRCLR
jgi:hypothetical protein